MTKAEPSNHDDPMMRPRYVGIPTFFRAPLRETLDEVDIALIGVPFDGGVTFSVDDHDAEYSSLAYFNTQPLCELKLDRAFISHVGSSEKDAVIVRATLEAAHNLCLIMVVSGVQDAAALDFLHSINCDEVHEYFLCRPLPASELEGHLPYIHRFTPVSKSTASPQGVERVITQTPHDKAA